VIGTDLSLHLVLPATQILDHCQTFSHHLRLRYLPEMVPHPLVHRAEDFESAFVALSF
jgi:hypothetical protein